MNFNTLNRRNLNYNNFDFVAGCKQIHTCQVINICLVHFWLQKAFVTERAELIENNCKKWDGAMQQRQDKEVASYWLFKFYCLKLD